VSPAARVALWALVPAVELWLAYGTWSPLPAWICVGEVLCFVVLGLSQERLARAGWLRSPLWPGLVAIVAGSLILRPAGWFGALAQVGGVAVAALALVVLLDRRGRAPWLLAGALAVAAPLGVRLWLEASLGASIEAFAPTTSSPWADRAASAMRAPADRLAGSGGADAPPIVWITVDTLRADHAVAMASHRRLAERGASWERAMSASPWTLPSLAALHTGEPAVRNGADFTVDGHVQGLSAGVPTIAEQLQERGYATAASVTNPWAATSMGFRRGFRTWISANETLPPQLLFLGASDPRLPIDGAVVVDRALAWLDGAPDRGFFLWVHLLDPHMPHQHATGPAAGLGDWDLRGSPPSPELKEAVRAAYAGEVAYADAQISRLLDALEAKGVLDGGMVVLTADHGEELWDHGSNGHGHTHHGELNDVALAVVAPGMTPAVRTDLASLLDLAPTTRAVAGLPPGGPDLRQAQPERVLTAYGALYAAPIRSARDGGHRVIAGDGVVAYDLAQDPRELAPLAADDADPLVRAALSVEAPARTDADAVDVEALRALGYMQ
jgi:arylsulfatase A-like enzyme